MALQSLSRYGAATFTRTGKPTQVTIQYSGTFFTKFQVDDDNRLLLQQTSLPKVPEEYTMTVTGGGCVYLQVRLLGTWGSVHITVLTENSSNSANDRANQRKELRKLGGVPVKRETQIFVSDVPQTSLKYNILPEREESPFALEVQTLPQTCDRPKAHTSFHILLNVR